MASTPALSPALAAASERLNRLVRRAEAALLVGRARGVRAEPGAGAGKEGERRGDEAHGAKDLD